jgi:CRP-like cAMP-binding protein
MPNQNEDNESFLSILKNEFFTSEVKWKKVDKGQILQEQGVKSNKAFFVKSGLLRSYTIDDNGKEHIFMFAPEGWVISDIQSHTLEAPAELFIDALETSEIIEISQSALETVQYDAEGTATAFKKLLRRLSVLQKRVILLMSASARQRYEDFLITYPELINRVPQKMIASYLGITPEALSNIRGSMRKKL